MDIGKRIRAARKTAGLSQEALAYQAGVALRTLSSLERGESSDPHFSTLAGIAAATGTTVGELVGEEPAVVPLAEPRTPPGPAPGEKEEEERRGGKDVAALAREVGVVALGSSVADALRPILRDQGEWSRDLAGTMRAARDPGAALRAVGREGDRLEDDFDKAVRALRPLRRELLAGLGDRAGVEEAGRAVGAFVDALRAGLDASYRHRLRALAHLHEQSKQGADRRAPQSGGGPPAEHRGTAATDQRAKTERSPAYGPRRRGPRRGPEGVGD